MISSARLAASDPSVRDAGDDYLLAGGGAIGAVLTCYFAAAGAHADVLMGPLVILFAGVGAGARVIDGRCRQPGTGAKRPRGFTADESIPPAARVAAPASVAAAFVALAYDETFRPAAVLSAGLDQARRSSPERHAVLSRIKAVGPRALSETAFSGALRRCAGPQEGGLITAADLALTGGLDVAASECEQEDLRVLQTPWASARAVAAGEAHGVAAIDGRGRLALAVYRRSHTGVSVEGLGLVAPFAAEPVLRGRPRVRPGTALPCGAQLRAELRAGRPVCLSAQAHADDDQGQRFVELRA